VTPRDAAMCGTNIRPALPSVSFKLAVYEFASEDPNTLRISANAKKIYTA
jgi:hypothetical protein